MLGKEFLIEASWAGELPFGYGGDFDAAVDSDGKKILEITPQYSYGLEDTIEFLLAFDGIIDIVQLRERDAFLAQPTTYNFTGVHQTADYARKIRTAGFHGLLALNGGFQDPSVVENYLRSGDCDLICMGGPFLQILTILKKFARNGPRILFHASCAIAVMERLAPLGSAFVRSIRSWGSSTRFPD